MKFKIGDKVRVNDGLFDFVGTVVARETNECGAHLYDVETRPILDGTFGTLLSNVEQNLSKLRIQ